MEKWFLRSFLKRLTGYLYFLCDEKEVYSDRFKYLSAFELISNYNNYTNNIMPFYIFRRLTEYG